ncbi:MAG: hypothetical protein HY720_24225 [Planctomycetes bacterium]|nr:hypothetical protein [Planctomycetota bacterium]
MIASDRNYKTAGRRTATRLVHGLEERLGIREWRDAAEERLLSAAVRLVAAGTDPGDGRRATGGMKGSGRPERACATPDMAALAWPLSGLGLSGERPVTRFARPVRRSDFERSLFPEPGPPAPGEVDLALGALGRELGGAFDDPYSVLHALWEHVAGVPAWANPVALAARVPLSLAAFQHLVAAVAGALAARNPPPDEERLEGIAAGEEEPGLALVAGRLTGVPPSSREERSEGGVARLVVALGLSAPQLLACDPERFIALAPDSDSLARAVREVESSVNRSQLELGREDPWLALEVFPVSRHGLADFGPVVLSLEDRFHRRERRPLQALLPDLFSGALTVNPPAGRSGEMGATGDALLVFTIKDLLPLFALSPGPRSIGRFLDVESLVRAFFQGYVPRLVERTAGARAERIHWDATGSGGTLAGPWDVLAEFAGELAREFRRFTGEDDHLALAGALVEPVSPGARERARDALLGASLKGSSTIEVMGRTLAWSDAEGASLGALLSLARRMRNALERGLPPGVLTWLAALPARHAVGEAQPDMLWEPVFLGGVATRLRDRRFTELRESLVAESRDRRTLVANLPVSVRFALASREKG